MGGRCGLALFITISSSNFAYSCFFPDVLLTFWLHRKIVNTAKIESRRF